MLNSFYATVFRPTEAQVYIRVAFLIGLLIVLILAFNAAGAIGLGAGGVLALIFAFLLAGFAAWYWLSASVNLMAQVMGGRGNASLTLGAIAQGLSPLILTGPAIAAATWSEPAGMIFSLAIALSVLFLLTVGVRRAHQLGWWEAIICLTVTLMMSGLALVGLIIGPMMLILGT